MYVHTVCFSWDMTQPTVNAYYTPTKIKIVFPAGINVFTYCFFSWDMTQPTVNAYYTPTKNEIVFPAGINVCSYCIFSWDMTQPTVNAYYTPTKNKIVFPAGINVCSYCLFQLGHDPTHCQCILHTYQERDSVSCRDFTSSIL